MDKNIKNASEFGLPNCESRVKHDFGSFERKFGTHPNDLYDESILNSIKKGFEYLGDSLIECSLILSSEDYANSIIKEREAKRKETETKRKKEEANKKKMKEDAEKILDLYKEKLKDQIFSIENVSDDEKNEIFNSYISDKPYGITTFGSIKKSIVDPSILSSIVKKSFSDAIKEVKPEFGKMFEDSINIDTVTLALIMPGVQLPPLTFMTLVSNNSGKSAIDPMMLMLMNSGDTNLLPFLMMNKISK